MKSDREREERRRRVKLPSLQSAGVRGSDFFRVRFSIISSIDLSVRCFCIAYCYLFPKSWICACPVSIFVFLPFCDFCLFCIASFLLFGRLVVFVASTNLRVLLFVTLLPINDELHISPGQCLEWCSSTCAIFSSRLVDVTPYSPLRDKFSNNSSFGTGWMKLLILFVQTDMARWWLHFVNAVAAQDQTRSCGRYAYIDRTMQT